MCLNEEYSFLRNIFCVWYWMNFLRDGSLEEFRMVAFATYLGDAVMERRMLH
jgi:hypothetical protein